jgi:hypothetical protein
MAAKKTTANKKQEEEVVEVEATEVDTHEEETEELSVETTEVEEDMYGDDGKELLFPGGPALDRVEEWKSLHQGEVYLTEFEEEVFLWRPIKRKEYKEIMKVQNADNYYKEERICEKCVMYPEEYNFMAMTSGKAGIPTLLAELVMEKSGFQAKTGALKV